MSANRTELYSWGGRAHYGDLTGKNVHTLCGYERPVVMTIQADAVNPQTICAKCAVALAGKELEQKVAAVVEPELITNLWGFDVAELLADQEKRERMMDKIDAQARLEHWS